MGVRLLFLFRFLYGDGCKYTARNTQTGGYEVKTVTDHRTDDGGNISDCRLLVVGLLDREVNAVLVAVIVLI